MTHLQELKHKLEAARQAVEKATAKYDNLVELLHLHPSTSEYGQTLRTELDEVWKEYVQADNERVAAWNAVEGEKARILDIANEGCTCDQETAVLGGTVCTYCREALSKEEMPF